MAMNELTELARALLAHPAAAGKSRSAADNGVESTGRDSASEQDWQSLSTGIFADAVRSLAPDISREVVGELREVADSRSRADESADSADSRVSMPGTTGRVVADLQALASAPASAAMLPLSESLPRTAANSPDDSLTGTVLKTAGLITGVGPIVSGLLKLFGSEGSPEPPPQLFQYQPPSQISLAAGLNDDRSFVPVSYGSSGVARPTAPQVSQSLPNGAQIHVNVNAIDSRSFLDHSDEIARAVRDAMLRSHSLNDVISEV